MNESIDLVPPFLVCIFLYEHKMSGYFVQPLYQHAFSEFIKWFSLQQTHTGFKRKLNQRRRNLPHKYLPASSVDTSTLTAAPSTPPKGPTATPRRPYYPRSFGMQLK